MPRAPSIGEEAFLLHLRLHDLLQAFAQEVTFHPERNWRFDFASPQHRIAVEIEGGTLYGKSRHSKGPGFEEDCRKYNAAAALGWSVYRFSTAMVKSGEAIAFIAELIGGGKCRDA